MASLDPIGSIEQRAARLVIDLADDGVNWKSLSARARDCWRDAKSLLDVVRGSDRDRVEAVLQQLREARLSY